jgi:hypothetical protein
MKLKKKKTMLNDKIGKQIHGKNQILFIFMTLLTQP